MFNTKPLVSVIMPMYTMPEEHFKRSLLSVIGSSGFSQNQLEVIIITASKKILDLTNRMKRSFHNTHSIRLVRVSKNKLLSEMLNLGIMIANGTYIGYVHSGDFVSPNFYKNLYDCISSELKAIDTILQDSKLYFIEGLKVQHGNLLPVAIGLAHTYDKDTNEIQLMTIKDSILDAKNFINFSYVGLYNKNFLIRHGILFSPDLVINYECTFLTKLAMYNPLNAVLVCPTAKYCCNFENKKQKSIIKLDTRQKVKHFVLGYIKAIQITYDAHMSGRLDTESAKERLEFIFTEIISSIFHYLSVKSHNNIVNHEICSSLAKLFCGAYNTFNKLYERYDTIYMVYYIMEYLIQNIPELEGVDLSSAENVAEKFCTIVQGKLNSHV